MKSDMIASIEQGYADWMDLLDSIAPENLTLPGVDGVWSVKDIIAHISWYEWWTAEFIRTRAWPDLPEHLNSEDTDLRNAAFYLESRDLPLTEIVATAHRHHEALVEAIVSLSAEDFADQTRLGMPAGEGWELPTLIPENSTRHYEAHAESIRAWLQRIA